MKKVLRRHSLSRHAQLALTASVAAVAALVTQAGCGADNSVVGGACATGYTQCGLSCVNLNDDPKNCGACGNVCADGICVDGTCGSSVGEAGRPDGSRDGGLDEQRRPGDSGQGDATVGDGTTGDGPLADVSSDTHFEGGGDGPAVDGPSGDAPVGDGPVDACAPPYDNQDNCGACGLACSSVQTCVQGDAGAYGCVDVCTAPLVDCGGACVDESSDPNNCGACSKFCPSGICTAGKCVGGAGGDIVLIGHDYSSPLSTLTSPKLLANAMFLPTSNPVRVLSFEHYADPVAVTNVKTMLAAEAAMVGRTLSYTVSVTDTDVPATLSTAAYDVLFVYDQELAAPGVLGPLGASWAGTVATFTAAGGVVVALDGAEGTTQEMPAFDTSAGLLAVSGHAVITPGTPLDVVAPGDAIGHGVFSPYAAEANSVYFNTSELNGGVVTYVVIDPAGDGSPPVAIHKAVP